MEKLLWVKFGWSDYYRGGPVNGNFGWFNQGDNEGHEAFNFLPGPDGRYYCYVPPLGDAAAAPRSDEPDGWTVVCLARFPERNGIHVVGWYENATLLGERVPRPEYAAGVGFRRDVQDQEFLYCITAETAFFVPPAGRTNPFTDRSVRQASFSYLSGPRVDLTPAKERVRGILLAKLEHLQEFAIRNPNPISAPDELEYAINPLDGFGTPEHRRAVEVAAEQAVTVKLQQMGYRVIRRAHENLGYDLQAIPIQDGQELYVEVKGTSGTERRFYMTPNEHRFASTNGWRLAMVTDALGAPDVTLLDHSEMQRCFSLQPMLWICREVPPAAQ